MMVRTFVALLAIGAAYPAAASAQSSTGGMFHVFTSREAVPVSTPVPSATPRDLKKPFQAPKQKPANPPPKAQKPKPSQAAKTQGRATSQPGKPIPPSVPESLSSARPVKENDFDDLEDYGDVPSVADPIEPVNRGIFWFNHQIYNYVVRPVSKVYTTVLPKPLRRAVHNVYDNAEYPVRVTNHLLQGELRNADLETRKFAVNTVGGVGGILKVSDRYPSLAGVPRADTGQTLGKWGIGHGPYIVLPVLGPRSARDTVGLVGDAALNPVTWIPIAGAGPAIALSISTPNTVRNTQNRLDIYDAATRDAIDPYVAIRSGYIQSREQSARRAPAARPPSQ